MSREEIIKMAQKAEMSPSAEGLYWTATLSDLERFFHMAQAAERKRQALANEALDKMAENARELGLDYEPAAWVGLTDKERNQLWRDVIKWGDPSHDDVDLMKAIEQALKEKNT